MLPLTGGPVPAVEIERLAKAAGITKTALRRLPPSQPAAQLNNAQMIRHMCHGSPLRALI
jgi:hypothetical protein